MGAGFGIYLHVPYCRSLCPYCDFNSHVSRDPDWQGLQAAWLKELSARRQLFEPLGEARSLYFGGGTPSLLPVDVLASTVEAVAQALPMAEGAELTLEANPGTLEPAGLRQLRALGINRLSMGWQSTHDRLLQVLGRGHSAADSRRAFEDGRAAGFDNISVDLIFAVPGQTLADLDEDLAALRRLRPEHISLYALTFHSGTEFGRRLQRGTLERVDEELEIEMMDRIDEALAEAGYEHYEVSNYALAGKRAVHNSLYWAGVPYLGLGPGAHSFAQLGSDRGWRWEGVRSPAAYIEAWRGPRAPGVPEAGDAAVSFVETLTARELTSERMLCGMRVVEGVDLNALPSEGLGGNFEAAVQEAERRAWAQREGACLRPTALGLRHADALAALFF